MKERRTRRRTHSYTLGSPLGAFFALLALLCLVASADGNVKELTDDNFDEVIKGTTHALVEFYAPWCGHCKKLAPVYEQLGDAFEHAKPDILIAKIDADQHRGVYDRFGIKGFPTLKWFEKGVTTEDYKRGRELDEFIDFIESNTGIKAIRPKTPKSAVTVLDSTNFDEIVFDKNKNVLVEFYAPWCGYCKKLAPIYKKVAATFANEPTCVVANLDATAATDIASKYDIQSYPTIKFFPKDKTGGPVAYSGGREEEEFINFLNERCGTHRAPGGGLLESAGRLPDFDNIAKQFSEETSKEKREAFYNQAKELAENLMLLANNAAERARAQVHDASNIVAGKAKAAAYVAGSKYDEVKAKASENVEAAKGAARGAADAAKEWISDTTRKAGEAAEDARVAGKGAAKAAFDEASDLKDKTSQKVYSAKDATEGAAAAAAERIASTKDKVAKEANNAAEFVVDEASKAKENVESGMKKSTSAARDAVVNSKQTAHDAAMKLGIMNEEAKSKAEKAKKNALTEEEIAAGKTFEKAEEATNWLQRQGEAVKNAMSGAVDDANAVIDAAKVKSAQYYVKVMEKINEQGDYVEKELARLRKIASTGSLAPSKLDEFNIRQNILKAFKMPTDSQPEVKEEGPIHEEL